MPEPSQTIHLHPTAPLAERVLLPGDPGRALALAQALLEEPRMFNHHRGLWGYTGAASDGEPLTIQATGMGGPSAAIVLTELIALGARRAIRVGTCGALERSLELGELVIAREAISADGTSRALGAAGRTGADEALTRALEAAAPDARAGAVVSVDLFYERGPAGAGHDALAVEMEAAALFALGRAETVPVACLLTVTDTFDAQGGRRRIDGQDLPAAAERMGRVAIAALAPAAQTPGARGGHYVTVARDLVARWNSGERDLAVIPFEPEVELHSPLSSVSGRPYRGVEGLAQWILDVDEQFDSWQIDVAEFREAERAVVVLGEIDAHGRASGTQFRQAFAMVADFSAENRIARVRIFLDRSEALAAAGLG